MYEIYNVRQGDDRYEQFIGQIRADRQLQADMWADAEHELIELPGKSWTVVAVDGTPVAWAAARVEQIDGTRVLKCSDNYERRGVGRDRQLYRLAYTYRHTTIVEPTRLPAVTYLFAQPMPLHEADGWRRTGLTGTSEHGHDWWELRRDPS